MTEPIHKVVSVYTQDLAHPTKYALTYRSSLHQATILIGHSSFLSLGSFHTDDPNYYRLSSFFIFVTWLTEQQQRRPTLLMHQFLLMKLIFPSCTGQGNPDLFPLLLLDSLACSRTLPLLPIIRLILMASPPPLFS